MAVPSGHSSFVRRLLIEEREPEAVVLVDDRRLHETELNHQGAERVGPVERNSNPIAIGAILGRHIQLDARIASGVLRTLIVSLAFRRSALGSGRRNSKPLCGRTAPRT